MGEAIEMTRKEPGVALIRIDNPPTNALGAAPRARLHAMLDEIDRDLSVRAVVVTGTGEAFCSGDDLKAMSGGGDAAMDKMAADLDKKVHDYCVAHPEAKAMDAAMKAMGG